MKSGKKREKKVRKKVVKKRNRRNRRLQNRKSHHKRVLAWTLGAAPLAPCFDTFWPRAATLAFLAFLAFLRCSASAFFTLPSLLGSQAGTGGLARLRTQRTLLLDHVERETDDARRSVQAFKKVKLRVGKTFNTPARQPHGHRQGESGDDIAWLS